MEFDPNTALSYAAAIARPRLVGSGEDRAVAQELSIRLEQFGYRVEHQRFAFRAAIDRAVALGALACMVLVLAGLLLRGLAAWAAVLPAVLLLAALVAAIPFFGAVQRAGVEGRPHRLDRVVARLGQRYVADNVIARPRNGTADPGLPLLMLVAHYDSKSQPYPIAFRVACIVLVAGGGLAFAVLALVGALAAPIRGLAGVVGAAATVAGVLALAGCAPLALLRSGNRSPGAIDNASGVGVVLHLAECLAQQPALRDQLRWMVLLTSAEELGVMGAAAYVLDNNSALSREAAAGMLHVLNFDGVGTNGGLRLAGARASHRRGGQLAAAIQAAAGALGLAVKPFSMIGLSYDHVPFAERGFDAVTLLTIGRGAGAVHTPRDTAGRLHVRGFDQAGRVTLKVAEYLARLDSAGGAQ